MNPAERQNEILERLRIRGYDTCGNLANEFNVSDRTIRRDIAVLMCFHPIETVFGRHGGGVRVMAEHGLDCNSSDHKHYTQKQTALLKKVEGTLSGEDLETFHSIFPWLAPQ